MKKLIALLSLIGVTGICFGSPFNEQIINGSGLVVSNNVTYVWNQKSLLVYDKLQSGGIYDGYPAKMFWSLTGTNLVPSIASNSVTGFQPGTQYWTNQTTVFSSYALSSYGGIGTYPGGFTVSTNILNGQAWVDVPIPANPDGSVVLPTLTVTIAPGTAATTNVYTMIFAPVINGTNAINAGIVTSPTPVQGVDRVTWIVAAQGVTTVTAKTNLPTAFLQGAKKLRLVSIASSDASTTVPGTISFLSLSGHNGN